MNQKKIKRNKIDICNICKEKKPLSWDHVPPKGGIKLSSVEIKEVFQLLSGREESSIKISQNGVKYRTICSECNSIIGTEFDPTLNNLNKSIINYIQSKDVLPKHFFARVKPIRLMKCILAHLVTAKINIDEVVTDQKIRESIFSSNTIPEGIHIHYWVYPFDCTVILRDFALPIRPRDFSNCTIANVIKYFPIGFIISDSDYFRGLESLSQYRDLDIDDEIDLKFDLTKIEDFDWPERVDENNIVFLTQESQNGIFATPKKKK